MSILINQSHATNSANLWCPSACGIFPVVNSTTQVIPIAGLTSSSIVDLTYIHPNTGGASQWFSSITPSANTLTIVLGTIGAATPFQETIIWQVLKF